MALMALVCFLSLARHHLYGILAAPPLYKISTLTAISVFSETVSLSPIPTFSVGGLGPAKDIWIAPAKMDDLTPFGITSFPSSGKGNLQIVTEIPANAYADTSNPTSTNSDKSTSILQLFFPQDSIDPARKPTGGAEFYATPLDISSAQNVSLRYRVFFPKNFNFVLAGKMPGLYAGHRGCSGGNAALDCFSTRLMWRKEGAGELYLYAPKDKQTDALCSAPGSICDAVYGLSIGRGFFKWATGNWTTVQQTVVLNTPGIQDGSFALDVNGRRVIERDDIMYRDKLVDNGSDQDAPSRSPSPGKGHSSTKPLKPTPTSGSTKDGGLLGPILGGLLHGLGLLVDLLFGASISYPTPTTSQSDFQPFTTISSSHAFKNPQPVPTATAVNTVLSIRSSNNEQVGFLGIFFSTFFGGHGDKYATPRDQYIWFKDFALAYNS